jgi:hypothetical protein
MYPALENITGATTKKTSTKSEATTIKIVDCFKYAIKNEGTANVIIDDSYLLLPGYTDSASNLVPMNGEVKIDFDGAGTKKVRVSLITAIRS